MKDLDKLPKDYEGPDFYLKEAEKMAADLIKFEKKQEMQAKTESN